MKLLPVFMYQIWYMKTGSSFILARMGVKELSVKVGLVTVEWLTLENVCRAVGAEPDIRIGVIYPIPIATYTFKNTIATPRLKRSSRPPICI